MDEVERRVLFLKGEAEAEEVEYEACPANMVASIGQGAESLHTGELDELGRLLSATEQRIRTLSQSTTDLDQRRKELLQEQRVLLVADRFLAEGGLENTPAPMAAVGEMASNDDSVDTMLGDDDNRADLEAAQAHSPRFGPGGVGFVAGTVARRRLQAFERVLWRALRGNLVFRAGETTTDIEPHSGEKDGEPLACFVAFVYGVQTKQRARRLCEALGATLFEVDGDAGVRSQAMLDAAARLDDLKAILFSARQAKRSELQAIVGNLEPWLVRVRVAKALYDCLNRFQCDADPIRRKAFIAEGWCPTAEIEQVGRRLRIASERAGHAVPPLLQVLEHVDPLGHGHGGGDDAASGSIPPTHYDTNRVLGAFQEMNDAYGVARYGEMNPSPFMIITFPFLFAVMFGDLGHGLIIALVGAWMCLGEAKLRPMFRSELLGMIFGGRYAILLMGLFSMFTGLLYNDIFSRYIPLFPSAFRFNDKGIGYIPNPAYSYPFGLDWAWIHAQNAMGMINSYKMKQSVVLGVIHMMFGLFLGLVNQVRSGNWLELFTNILPQIIFMSCLFVYLVFMIIYKWIMGVDHSILNGFIGMVLRFGAVDGTPLYPGQSTVQLVLVLIAFLCVPWLLLSKPLYLYLQQRRSVRGNRDDRGSLSKEPLAVSASAAAGVVADDALSAGSKGRKVAAEGGGDEGDHGMGEVMVHQLIHTIEFVLGSVSNTASYLRLWALSLAHAQLSDVIWDLILQKGFPYLLPLTFAIWLAATLGIMVGMEGMSAFLHALRLHWVEFNNKFYAGSGVKFEPFHLDREAMLN